MKHHHTSQIQNLYYQEGFNAHEIKRHFKRRFSLHAIKRAIAHSEMEISNEKFIIIPSEMNY